MIQPEIAFVSAQEGWVSLTSSNCRGQGITIWHTIDGGTTWEQLAADGLGDDRCKLGLSFTDATHGFLTPFDPASSNLIYRTADGGRTWQTSRLADPPGATRPALFALQQSRVSAFGTTLLVSARDSGSTKEFVYRSTDGGASWAIASSAPVPGAPIAFSSATRWLQVVPGSPWQETTDAGTSWHTFGTDYTQAAPIDPEIVFGDVSTAFATVRGELRRTVDGGAHWSVIKTPGTS